MATELNWATIANYAAPDYSSTTAGSGTINLCKFYGWFLVQSLIGAHPQSASISTDHNFNGYWHLMGISSGSTVKTYADADKSYRTGNLWMPTSKTFETGTVPFMRGGRFQFANYQISGVNANDKAWYDPIPEFTAYPTTPVNNINWDNNYPFAFARGMALLRSPLIGGKNYYMLVDMFSVEGLDYQPRIFISNATSSTFNSTNRPLSASGTFSYFMYDQSYIHSFLFFNNVNTNEQKVSISISDSGSFWYYHTYNNFNAFRAVYAFTELKNYSAQDQNPVAIIRARDGEVNSSAFTSGRGFIPRSFAEMSTTNAGITGQPVAFWWYVDSNILSYKTTMIAIPRHNGQTLASPASYPSGSCGYPSQIVNVFDYSLVNSPLYAQSDINSQFGEMPIIVGQHGVDTTANYKALRGRIPDFKFASVNLVQGSVRPSNGPFEYVKVGGFWCPWDSTVAASL